MLRKLKVTHEAWPLGTPFRISRGVKTVADVVVVEITENGVRGRGEGVPYPRYGESVASVLEEIRGLERAIADGLSRDDLQERIPAGAARNALDCALWDLAARLTGQSVTEQLGHGPVPALPLMLTIGIDTPDAMHARAQELRGAPVLKVKLDSYDPAARLRAVRAGAPGARLIVDANEAWSLRTLEAMQPVLEETNVELVEQPLPASEDLVLEGFKPARPICADESCHVAADIEQIRTRYQAINIKLDKTGGLSGAMDLFDVANAEGLLVMCGCMVATSLSIAPAFHIARHCAFADLDGPIWLEEDRDGGVRMDGGTLLPPAGALWGGD